MTTASQATGTASAPLRATIRCVYGPSLESEGTVMVVGFAGDARAGEAIAEPVVAQLRAILSAIGAAAPPEAGPPPTAGHLTAFVAGAVASAALGQPWNGTRPSRLFDRSFVLAEMPRQSLRHALRLAATLLAAASAGGAGTAALDGYRAEIERLRNQSAEPDYNRNDAAITIGREAGAMGLPVRWSTAWPQVLIVGEGRRQTTVVGSFPTVTRYFGTAVTADKTWMKTYFERLGLPVLPHRLVDNVDAAVDAAKALGYPVVLKPADGANSQGVTVDIRSASEVGPAFALAVTQGNAVIVQPYLALPDFRAFVVDGRVRIVYRRNPPFVVGDGRSTVRRLIERHNEAVAAGRAHFPAVAPVLVDDHLELTLSKGGRTLDSVPGEGEEVVLRAIPLRANGGYMVEVTDEMHPENVRLLERALRLGRLLITGLDFRAESVSIPWHAQRFALLELNLRPALWDYEGDRIARELLRAIFPSLDSARLPTMLVIDEQAAPTGPLRRILRERGLSAGVSASDGVHLDDFPAARAPLPIAEAHVRMIEDSTADVAIHVATSAEIAAGGLGLQAIGCTLLAAAPGGPAAAAVAGLARRLSARTLALPADPAGRDAAIVEAAAQLVAGSPLPPYAGL